jgi:sugar phosphate isomerase/epimerase
MHRELAFQGVRLRHALSGSLIGLTLLLAAFIAPRGQRMDGFNVIVSPGHPFGSVSAESALVAAKRLGATTIAIIPFLWQSSPSSPDILRGADMSDDALRQAIRQARALGFSIVVKPHVWVPDNWAGAITLGSEQAWSAWFAHYRVALDRIARVAAAEGADVLVIGTELAGTTQRSEWEELIAATRASFPGTLTYVAHNIDEAETVPFWHLLDTIGVSLYPPLGADHDRAGRRAAMRDVAERLDTLSKRIGKSVVVGEIGLRSAEGATAKPWESAEERAALPDSQLQAEVLADWLAALDRPAVRGVLIWRWFTDPAAGGAADTDFTVQGKPAEEMLRCVWKAECR